MTQGDATLCRHALSIPQSQNYLLAHPAPAVIKIWTAR